MSNHSGGVMTQSQIKNLGEYLNEVTSTTINWKNYQILAEYTEDKINNLINYDKNSSSSKPIDENKSIGTAERPKGAEGYYTEMPNYSHDIDKGNGYFGSVAECLALADEVQPSELSDIEIAVQVNKVALGFYHTSIDIILTEPIANKYLSDILVGDEDLSINLLEKEKL